jgi:hypothetical protein
VIVVDTNVISELMRGEPHSAVLAWITAQPCSLLYTTHIEKAEITNRIDVTGAGGASGVLVSLIEKEFVHHCSFSLKHVTLHCMPLRTAIVQTPFSECSSQDPDTAPV